MGEKQTMEVQEFYNNIAREFVDDWYANDSLLLILKQFLALLPASPKVLDLGCGAGYESMRLKRLGAEVTGVDFSEEPIKIAREKNPDIRFEIQDFRYLGPELGPFDGIVAVASLIHIQDDELEQVFFSMNKVLNDSGYIMIVVVEGQGVSLERSHIERNGRKYHRHFYLHNKEELTLAAYNKGITFSCEFELQEEFNKYGWKCYVFQKGYDHERKNPNP